MSLDDYSSVHFGKVLKKLREARSLSQEQLAHGSNLDRSYISMLERDIKKPGLDTIIALGKGLEMRASEIIKELEEQPENEWLLKDCFGIRDNNINSFMDSGTLTHPEI